MNDPSARRSQGQPPPRGWQPYLLSVEDLKPVDPLQDISHVDRRCGRAAIDDTPWKPARINTARTVNGTHFVDDAGHPSAATLRLCPLSSSHFRSMPGLD